MAQCPKTAPEKGRRYAEEGRDERAAGGVVTAEPKDVTLQSRPHPTPVRIAFCRGPAGESIEFVQNELT